MTQPTDEAIAEALRLNGYMPGMFDLGKLRQQNDKGCFGRTILTHAKTLSELREMKEERPLREAKQRETEAMLMDQIDALRAKLAVAVEALELEYYAAGIGHSEIEDGGKTAAQALAQIGRAEG